MVGLGVADEATVEDMVAGCVYCAICVVEGDCRLETVEPGDAQSIKVVSRMRIEPLSKMRPIRKRRNAAARQCLSKESDCDSARNIVVGGVADVQRRGRQ